MSRMRGKHAFFALAACAGLAGVASCLSGDEAPAGGRVEHPPQRAPMPVASVAGAHDASAPPPEGQFTPLDQAIADDCERPKDMPGRHGRPWSQNVPDRDCTSDGECGDGYCDRGHCAAIWTCHERYGQRCIHGRPVPSHVVELPFEAERCAGICLEGRCRSCQSDAECMEDFRTLVPDATLSVRGFMCGGRDRGSGRACGNRWPSRL
jgi:hypothetical protein